ncbi:permease for cytosine/purines, uracil, thiamine, allantoin-domain-containing protein [Xylariomycetidae sp. FL2044]|nr:permease for cytosine/purines, uracil, thiamine, allantoin-domain-containing protein [Xylariomycetidae sp. FL2044]
MGGGASDLLKALEVKPTDDEFEAIATSRWGNKDVYPIPHDKRTYGWLAFYAYWGTCGISLSSWTIGSSLIGIGLTAGQACAVVLVGCVIASLSAYLNGAAGAIHHLGYGTLARAAFGLWGSYFVVMLNVFQSFIFYGTQMYFGGMAFVIILNSIFPSFLTLANTLPASAGITTPQLIGFVLFILLYFPVIYFIPPHVVQKYLIANLVVSSATLLGIMGWAVRANGGSAGDLVAPAVGVPPSQVGFLMVQGITSVAGTYVGGSDRVSDWTRYARSRHAPTLAQLTALPLTVTLVALIGIVTTSATAQVYGTVQWNPVIMLQMVQQQSYTAACRAGTFFAGLGLLCVTVFINYTQNCVSSGMDVAMLLPRWVSRRRGSIVFSVLGVLANPWRFLTQASTFITVLSSFGVFMSPAGSILVVDFWLVRKCQWNIPDLYTPEGIYWFWNGLNWRAFVSYLLGMVWALPGFIQAVGGPAVSDGWYHLYQVSFFFGYAVSGGLFYMLNLLFPPPGLGVQVDFELMDGGVVEHGAPDVESGSQLDGDESIEKKVAQTTAQV